MEFAQRGDGHIANKGPVLEAVVGLFLALTWISMMLRVYVRGFLTKSFGADDWFMGIALFLFSILSAMVFWGIACGTGKHMSDLTAKEAQQAVKSWYFSEIVYAWTTAFVKLSLGVFLLRVAVKRWHRIHLIVITSTIMLFTFAFFFFIVFQCSPIYHYWTRIIHLEQMTDGSCVSATSSTVISYAHSALSTIADWTYAILPILMVWNLNMEKRTKVLVSFILGMGAIGCVAVVVRIVYIYQLGMNEDFLWNTTDLAIWSILEPGIGIIAGSMATLRPLFRVINNKIRRAKGLPSHEEFWRNRVTDEFMAMESGVSSKHTRGSYENITKSTNSHRKSQLARIHENPQCHRSLSGSTLADPNHLELGTPMNPTTITIVGGLDARLEEPPGDADDWMLDTRSIRVQYFVDRNRRSIGMASQNSS